MPRLLPWLPMLLLAAVFPGSASADAGARGMCLHITAYVRPGCPHCEDAQAFLAALGERVPALSLRIVGIATPGGAEAFRAFVRERGILRPGVPTLAMCECVLVGVDAVLSPPRIREEVAGAAPAPDGDATQRVRLPLLGTVSPTELGLPLFTLLIGAVDGFNPCAMWVLLFLLSLLVHLRDRGRMLVVAGTFVLVSGAVYYAFMAAWLNLFLVPGLSRELQFGIGVVALLVAAAHLEDAVVPGTGPVLNICGAARPGVFARMRAVVQAENLTGALLWVVLLAVMVNVVELLCTAGLPALYTRILTLQPLDALHYQGYLLLYVLAYMADDALMVAIAVASLGQVKLERRRGRWLKLLSGVTVAGLGILLLVAPDALF